MIILTCMNGLIGTLPRKIASAPPAVITAAALAYEIVLGLLDYNTPPEMSFTVFYLLGVIFAGWGAGARPVIVVSAVSAAIMAAHERFAPHHLVLSVALSLWNASTRFLLFCVSGWLTAEITRLNRHLQTLVEARTAQLHAETENHKTTSAQLSDALARLRAIIASVPIIVFAVDRKGIITFEDGLALKSLGFSPGAHVGHSVLEAYGESQEIPDHVRRALNGEDFSAQLQLGSVTLQAWYSPLRDQDATVCGYTGVAINITDLRRLERQILEISDREQARIGQEIHDGLCQQLVSLAFDANSLEAQLLPRALPETQIARRMALCLDQAITEARQLARGLFPIRLQAQGLPSALEELAHATRDRFKIDCRFESGTDAAVHSQTQATHLYRIAQEAVTNAIKHGRARSILIHLRSQMDRLELSIEDNGAGMDNSKPNDSGMGLHIMDYRARSVGGTLFCRPRAPSGTVISCCLPLSFD